jgi:hypothetical protein
MGFMLSSEVTEPDIFCEYCCFPMALNQQVIILSSMEMRMLIIT